MAQKLPSVEPARARFRRTRRALREGTIVVVDVVVDALDIVVRGVGGCGVRLLFIVTPGEVAAGLPVGRCW